MNKKKTPLIWVLLIILAISLSNEYANMARQTSLTNALAGFVVMLLLVGGIILWIKRSKR
jgi:hypothetical protein